ncbi:acetylglutamate kinase [Kozakia baliensis]|uniref:Acetylglutamate kinase n=1 Tax=Kozakia baliensis TaxID=153496 RepID=A0A1D8URQ7_9PROT|nr:acetylglutamate kinase [Kozakia baliensis]AOX16329.1 acetylglutamate kinase [Kozakia baliensis]AOX19290.1 acetylglutamate kinase [Kozakia baliensis]GBR28637.1 acetylglutamate kinase [Kozakia baliensis NRIC 0488]GEL63610.1 acetylglutamate kinase [Kozakia baliensis]
MSAPIDPGISDVDAAEKGQQQAAILASALPFLRRYAGDTIVVKYGGHAMGVDHLSNAFGRDIALLKLVGINPIVVHGGGPQINAMLKQLNIQSTFIDGLRVTDQSMIDVIEMVLSGSVNKQVANLINRAGALAVGISGKDGSLLQARKLVRTVKDPDSGQERELNLGFVGEPTKIDPRVLYSLLGSGLIPVIAPVGVGEHGETYNINADTAAGAIAGSVNASRLLMLTDVAGVLDENGVLIPELTANEARRRIADGSISGGMIPKVETCLAAVRAGAKAAVILDGRVPHACLLELFTRAGSGTLIKAE